MKRTVIQIDEDLCIGCGLCTTACQEGVIEIVDGKAKVMHSDLCDGIGNCMPVCPTDAITFSTQEISTGKDKEKKMDKKENTAAAPSAGTPLPCGCPGKNAKTIERKAAPTAAAATTATTAATAAPESELRQWPVQIKLVPVNAPYLNNSNLLIAADCTAFAYGNFHSEFMRNKITLIGCPKLDEGDYSEKLTAILKENNIKSVTVVRMEVPCCSGLANAAIQALKDCGKMIPWQIVTISTDGQVLEQ